ncbi:MAG: hypothetical protein R3A47_02265 [Polyangiales bacterium]
MLDARLDPEGFYSFDLNGGTVTTRAGERVVVLSEDVLASLVEAAARDGDLTPLRRLGERLGDQAHRILNQPTSSLSAEAIFSAVSGISALFGWGRIDFERWGDALVVSVTDLARRFGSTVLLHCCSELLQLSAEKQAACVPVGPGRFIMVDLEVAGTVGVANQRAARWRSSPNLRRGSWWCNVSLLEAFLIVQRRRKRRPRLTRVDG